MHFVRTCLLVSIYHALHARGFLFKQLRHGHASPTRNSTQPGVGILSVESRKALNNQGAGAPAPASDVGEDDLPGLSKYQLLATVHRGLKKVFAYHPNEWWKDWKIWVGVTLWLGVRIRTFCVFKQSPSDEYMSEFLLTFGINIVVLHLLMYAATPQRGLEITVVLVVFQAFFRSFRALQDIGVALTFVAENLSHELLIPQETVMVELESSVKAIVEESGAKILAVNFRDCSRGSEDDANAPEVLVEVVVNDRAPIDELVKEENLAGRLAKQLNLVQGIKDVSCNVIDVKQVNVEASGDNCIKTKEFECDTMYMDMTLPWFQILVLFIAQIGVWWFYFASVLWNLDLHKINYTFWMASFIVMQVTMIFNRGDDSVLGAEFPVVEWYTLIRSIRRSPTLADPETHSGPIPVHMAGLIVRGIVGYLCNTVLREIMAFTIPLMLSSFVEPMDFVVYCVGVNFICTVDDMRPKKFVVHTDADKARLTNILKEEVSHTKSLPDLRNRPMREQTFP
jgi:hypothetical protein